MNSLTLLKGDLDWIVMKCLEKDRSRRYDTANGLAADIKRHLDNEPVLARPPSAAYKFQKAFRRNKLVFAAGGAVVAALFLGISASTWQSVRATRAKREALAAQASESVQHQKAEANEAAARLAQANEAALRQLAQNATTRLRQSVYAADMNVAYHALDEGNLGRARELLNGHVPEDGEPDLRGFEWRYRWGLSRGDAEHIRQAHDSAATCITFSPDGRILATGGADQLIHLWDLASLSRSSSPPQPHRTLRGHENQVWALAFSPDGRKLASASKDSRIAVWNRDPKEPVPASAEASIEFKPGRPRADSGPISGGNLRSSNGRLVARVQSDFSVVTVELRGATSDRLLFLLPGHRINLASMVFSPSDKFLATGGHDHVIRLWETATGRELFVLRGHLTSVSALVFASDERTLASGSSDGTVKLWSVAHAVRRGSGARTESAGVPDVR